MYNTCSTWLNVGLLVPCRKNDSIASTVSGSPNSSNPLMLCETDGSSVREDEDGKLGMMSSSLNVSKFITLCRTRAGTGTPAGCSV